MKSDSPDFDDVNQFSPDGRLHQVEFATNATLNSGTALGMKGSDGIVFAVENVSTDSLSEPSGSHYTFTIDQHIGTVVAGLIPDARNIVNEVRNNVNEYRIAYGSPVPLNYVMQKMSAYMHEFTLKSDNRPFGASLIVGSNIPDGPKLCCIEPSGAFSEHSAWAIGKAAEAARSEMEKIDIENKPIAELIKEAAKVIYAVHEDETNIVLELSWCGSITDGKHESVPPDVFKEAEDYAKEETYSSSSSDSSGSSDSSDSSDSPDSNNET